MAKSADFNKTGVDKIDNSKPAVYRIETEGGKTNYIGSAGRGNVQDRLNDHLGKIPGAKVRMRNNRFVATAVVEFDVIQQGGFVC